MPLSLPNLFRGLIMLLLAAHVFYMYNTARTMDELVGISPGSSAIAAMFALVMLIPLVWAVALPEFPEMYLRHVRAKRWYQQGRCPDCGYMTTATRSERCPECGANLASPQPYAVSFRTVRLFVLINLLAWLIGSAAGEGWVLADEYRFREEAVAHVADGGELPYQRARWWPSDAKVLMWREEEGMSGGALKGSWR